MKCPLCKRKRLRKAMSCGRQRTAFFSRRNGADDEGAGSDIESGCGKLKWWEAAEIMGVTDRTMRRWRERLNEHGYSGLWDYRKRSPSPKRVAMQTVEQVLQLYREKYFD